MMSLIGYRHERELFCIHKKNVGEPYPIINCSVGGPPGSPYAGEIPNGPWERNEVVPAYRQWHAWCFEFRPDGNPALNRNWYGLMKKHPWYGKGGDLRDQCENFYQSWWADGKQVYVRCMLEPHPIKNKTCVPEGKETNGGVLVKHYCPNVPRVPKVASTDPDLNHALGPTETANNPENYGKWGAWALDFLETSSRLKCPSYSWTPPELTTPNDANCIAYRERLGMTQYINEASVVSHLGEEEQEVDGYDECGDESKWTVTVMGAANLGYETQRTIYAYDSGGGCATTLVDAQAAETWEWPLVKVRDNLLYNYIDSSFYKADDSDGATQYLLINGCFSYFSVHDSNQIPTQRSATWPTFDVDGNLVASNPC
jgi:hypothetical protein